MELHDQIRIGREAKGMTREELAASMVPRVSEQAVIYWEDGTNVPRMPRLKQLEKILGLQFNITGASPAGNNRGGVKAEDLDLAIAISRLPKLQREAIKALVDAGTLKTTTAKKRGGRSRAFFDKAEEALPSKTGPAFFEISSSGKKNGPDKKQHHTKASTKR